MSSMERNKGKLVRIDKTFQMLRSHGYDISSLEKLRAAKEHFQQECGEHGIVYLSSTNRFYEKVMYVDGSDDMHFADVQVGEGIIEFDTCHYNGGGHWSEIVDAEVKRQRECK